ncbi:MAG: DUF4328 domain-containing protein [Acidobacteriota bacterium]|jgi:heme/copper-type cytochrome/quinol oxidase subunit 2|nr:DUF4328 domain-containing protein [Acidobacteriota bacterium]
MTDTFNNYLSPKTYSYLAMGFLAATFLTLIFYIIGSLVLIISPNAQMDMGDGSSMQIGLAIIGILSLIEIPLRIATVVFFLMWLYHAYKNLSALKAQHLEFSPGWAVGWWFIPLANLVKPFQVVRELWNESDPEFDEELGFLAGDLGAPTIIGFWWATFLISGFLFRISSNLIDNAGNIDTYFPTVLLLGAIINAVAAVLAIIIVKKITEKQEQRFQRIGSSIHELPPQPPVFNG